MINMRQHAGVLHDENGGFQFRKLTNISIPKPYFDLTWDALHDLRSKVKKGTEAILNIMEKEERTFSENEEKGFNFGMALLDAINEDFEIRSERNTREPVDLSTQLTKAYHASMSTERDTESRNNGRERI